MTVRSQSFYMTVNAGIRSVVHPQVISANLNFSESTPLPLTKCVVTVGPACQDSEKLKALIDAGATGFRFNMSHVKTDSDKDIIETLRTVLRVRYLAAEAGRQVAIFSDMQGPEFRVQVDKDLECGIGDRIRFTTESGKSSREDNGILTIHLRAPDGYQLIRDIRRNEKLFRQEKKPRVFIDDGKVAIELDPWETLFGPQGSSAHFFWGTVRHGTKIEPNKGVNFPTLDLPYLYGMTKADNWVLSRIFDQKFVSAAWEVFSQEEPAIDRMVKDAIPQNAFHLLAFDYLAPSFVRSREDLDRFKHALEVMTCPYVQLIPKIETVQAVQPGVLKELLSHPLTVGVMVARGDLAAQVGFTRVPYHQQMILHEARRMGRFSIVATDVLGSMTYGNPHATRAEHDSLFSMMEHGAHSFMLSNETAKGHAPVDVVRYGLSTFQDEKMERGISDFGDRKVQQAEILSMRQEALRRMKENPEVNAEDKEQEELYLDMMSACLAVQDDPHIDGVVLWSQRGKSMRSAAQVLAEVPIFVVTDNPRVAREGTMTRGIYPVLVKKKPQDGAELEEIIRTSIPAFSDKQECRLKVMHNLG